MKELGTVTLFGVDCVDINRLITASEICQREMKFGDVKLLSSIPSNNPSVFPIPAITSIKDYSSFMIRNAGDYVKTEFALVIQYDGFIVNPAAWNDQFLRYDYIGAPWWADEKFLVGQGGFSLRSQRLMKILQQIDTSDLGEIPEDWYIAVTKRSELEAKGMRFAPADLARQFSFEGNEKEGIEWNGQFGFHGLKWTDISKWLQKNPEYPIENKFDDWALGMKAKLNIQH